MFRKAFSKKRNRYTSKAATPSEAAEDELNGAKIAMLLASQRGPEEWRATTERFTAFLNARKFSATPFTANDIARAFGVFLVEDEANGHPPPWADGIAGTSSMSDAAYEEVVQGIARDALNKPLTASEAFKG